MGKIIPSDICHFSSLVLNLRRRNLTVNCLSVTDDWKIDKMDGHLKRNVKNCDIQDCLTFFVYRQRFSLIRVHSVQTRFNFVKSSKSRFYGIKSVL